jgi:hypothetical protein
MVRLGEVRNLLSFALRYPGFLRRRVTVAQARSEIRHRLAHRGDNLLRWVRRAVYDRPASPYRALLHLAGCAWDDLERDVRKDGVEATLLALRRAGVYVSYEEFKGRQPIVRHGREIPTGPGAFDNPFRGAALERTTGGSTGNPTRVMVDLDYFSSRAANLAVVDDVHGVLDTPWGLWFGVLPDCGPNVVLSRLPYAPPPERWFTPVASGELRRSWRMRLGNAVVVRGARWSGRPIPAPEPVPLEGAGTIARWMWETVRRRGRCLLKTYVSLAMRVSRAAMEQGLSLQGAVFTGGGEPPTEAKVRAIERSGATFLPTYFFAEGGPVGAACRAAKGVNDLHLLEDRLALVPFPRPMGATSVDAFLFTTLLPSAPKLLLNVESDDYGVVEERRCGCGLEAEGYGRHVRDIRSFGKLTSDGMTLIGSEALRVLEDVLPSRFAASPLDFQLIEAEDADALTRLLLVVSPRVAADDDEIVSAMLDGLAQGPPAADLARAIWRQAGTVRVIRREPSATVVGKSRPLGLRSRDEVA